MDKPIDANVAKEIDRKRAQWEALYRGKIKDCAICGFNGWVSARRSLDLNEYGFRCRNCDAADLQNLSRDIPYWTGQEGFTKLPDENFKV